MRDRAPSSRAWLRALRHHRVSESTLLVPVPEAEFVYDCWLGDRALVGVPGLPLHVTVLYPFLNPSAINSGVEHELQQLARAQGSFEYSLSAVGRFPGVLYLTPAPSGGFVELTNAVVARWPTHLPYGGAYPDIVPHITLALGNGLPGMLAAVEPALPVKAVARELLLMLRTRADGNWMLHARFPFAD
jgi:2'-5' RNA ligase